MSRAASVARVTAGMALAACGAGAGDTTDSSAAPAAIPATPTVSAVSDSSPAPDGASRATAAPTTAATASPPRTRSATGDSVRGIVAVVGSAPMTQLVVRPADGPSVTITGDTAGLRALSGADVMVSGARTGPRELSATSFVVRTVDGMPAADGVLERAREGYALRLADGTRRALVRPPAALTAHVGARVWVTGPANAEPQSFGVISH